MRPLSGLEQVQSQRILAYRLYMDLALYGYIVILL